MWSTGSAEPYHGQPAQPNHIPVMVRCEAIAPVCLASLVGVSLDRTLLDVLERWGCLPTLEYPGLRPHPISTPLCHNPATMSSTIRTKSGPIGCACAIPHQSPPLPPSLPVYPLSTPTDSLIGQPPPSGWVWPLPCLSLCVCRFCGGTRVPERPIQWVGVN